MVKDWLQIVVWATILGVIAFIIVMPTSLSFGAKTETAVLFAVLGGVLRYFFIPVGYWDILGALTFSSWRTEKEIRDLILTEKGVPKDGLREIVGPVHHHLMTMHRNGFLRIRPRHDPSGLRSSSPPMEYRLTHNGNLLLKSRWTDEPNPPLRVA